MDTNLSRVSNRLGERYILDEIESSYDAGILLDELKRMSMSRAGRLLLQHIRLHRLRATDACRATATPETIHEQNRFKGDWDRCESLLADGFGLTAVIQERKAELFEWEEAQRLIREEAELQEKSVAPYGEL